ncbi:cytochrome c3 family protein [Persephonella sp.]
MFFRKILPLTLSVVLTATAGIELTKHNLSVTGPGSIKATTENEICVFCHIPHHEREGTPLWNRKMPTTQYTLYDSEFIQRINYPTPLQPSLVEGQPGIVSRQCLSCHDGTVAIGAVYIVRGTELGNQVIQMQGVNPDGTLPNNLRSFIGTDLSLHHPVAVEYNPNISKTFPDGTTKTVELRNPPLQPIKLYDYGGTLYVECTSCHDPHKQNKMFLRVDVGNLAKDFNQTCISCHEKPGWDVSVHATETAAVYQDAGVTIHYGEGSQVSVADLGCGNCHKPHATPPNTTIGKPLLRHIEENTCFKGASGNPDLAPCHSTGGTKNIDGVLPPSNPFGHPVKTIEGVHTILDVLYGVGSTEIDPANTFTIQFSDSKHAECMDCHNPHKAQKGTHAQIADASGWYPQTPTNNVSNVLQGVTGIEPYAAGYPARWTQATENEIRATAEATKEYQICMKCHSYWALGASPTGDCVTQFVSDQSGIVLTDQACEFNPYNRSAHPVVMSTNEMGTLSGWNQAVGRYAPPLTTAQLLPPWNTNVGNQTMYCSDCHGAPDEAGVDPRGPHGSTHKFMLKGPNTNWPTKPDGTLYTTGDVKAGTDQGLFCKNCHDLTQAEVHMMTRPRPMSSIACVKCHVAVPHGSPVSRLIGYETMPEPYNFNYQGVLQLRIRGFWYDPNGVWNSRSNVYAPSCGGGGGCHNSNAGGYDSYP